MPKKVLDFAARCIITLQVSLRSSVKIHDYIWESNSKTYPIRLELVAGTYWEDRGVGRGRKKVFLHRRDISDQRCPTSLIIRKIQIKTTMRYYLTLFRMAITKKSTISKCWRGRGERELSYTAGGDVSGCSHYGKCIEVPQKTKNRATYDPAIFLLGIYSKEMKSLSQSEICTPMFIVALFTVA